MEKPSETIIRRRILLKSVAAIAGIPLLKLLPGTAAYAQDLPHLSEDDPAAKALKYRHDATQASRTDKPGTPAKEQFCNNCMFLQGESGAWRPCQLFPGKAVNENGWCLSWTRKQPA